MNLRAFLSQKRNRLAVALVAAVIAHVCVLVAAHLGLLWNAVPSDQNRVLTLTLENTTEQGLFENELAAAETKNDVREGQLQDVKPRKQEGDLVTAQALSAEGETLPNAEPPVADSPISDSAADESAQVSASPLGEEGAMDLQSSMVESNVAAETLDNPAISDVPLLASNEGNVSISMVDGAPDLLIAEKVEVTESEQRMLDQKIKFWSENMNALEDMSESMTWQEQGQTFVANFSRVPASGAMDLDEVVVEISTEKDGERLTTELRMKKLAFSNFGQFVHRWDQNISLHDDEMSGRFHSNTKFNLQHSRKAQPTFSDKVTTASYRVNLNGPTSKKNIFLGGLETGVKRIDMPKPRLLFPEAEAGSSDQENTIVVETSSRLVFLEEGAVLIQTLDEAGPPRKVLLGDTPMYIFASPKARLHISGVVNGAVAVYSPNRIVIESDISYRSFDALAKGGDFLGLISGRKVIIAPRRVTGDGDLTIHAAIYARSRFVVTQRQGRRSGVLTVHGSVSAGSLSATEPRYATKVIFDRRLEDVRPPGFPVTDRYELASSEQGWTREMLPGSDVEFDIDDDLLGHDTFEQESFRE